MLEKYRMPLLELAGGLGGGLLIGGLGALLGRWLGGWLFPPIGDIANTFGDLIGAVLGFGQSYPVGVALGMALMRRGLKRPAEFWPALAGAVLGAGLVLAMLVLLRLSEYPIALQSLFIGLPPVTALIVLRLWAARRQSGPAS